MMNNLWYIVIKETFIHGDLLLVAALPILALIIIYGYFKSHRVVNIEAAWQNIGRRYGTLGGIIAILVLLSYSSSVIWGYCNRSKDNAQYQNHLRVAFRDYFSKQKNYTTRLMEFADRISDTSCIKNEMDVFASNLPIEERENFGRTWSASLKGGDIIHSGNAFNEIEKKLYWTDEDIENYRKKHNASPGVAELKYTKEQIAEYKKSNWAKLYPMLDHEQWIFIKNQILNIDGRDRILGFLRDISDCYQNPNPTESLNKLYDNLANLACPTDLMKIKCYLSSKPQLYSFYKFSLKHRFWFRTLFVAALYLIVAFVIIAKGKRIESESKKKIF